MKAPQVLMPQWRYQNYITYKAEFYTHDEHFLMHAAC